MFDKALYTFATIVPIFLLSSWNLNMVQGMAFVYGTLALLGISFGCDKKRDYKDKKLGIILLLALLSVFIHSFSYSLGHDITGAFINFCIMSEGFIFVFAGCLLFWLIIHYKHKFNILYPILIISILNLFFVITQVCGLKLIWIDPNIKGVMGTPSQLAVFSALSIPILYKRSKYLIAIPIVGLFFSHSYTGLCALFLVIAWYLINIFAVDRSAWIKAYIKFWSWIEAGVLFFLLNFKALIIRFSVRLETWGIAVGEILKSPVFGHGFDNTLSGNMVISYKAGGWTFRHNDLLNITKDLGLVFSVVLVLFIINILRKSKVDEIYLAMLIILVSCLFQTSLYFPRIAIFLIVLLALKQVEICQKTN